MKAKTRFMKWFYNTPKESRVALININEPWLINPMSINVIASEIRANTKLGKRLLKELGWKDD